MGAKKDSVGWGKNFKKTKKGLLEAAPISQPPGEVKKRGEKRR